MKGVEKADLVGGQKANKVLLTGGRMQRLDIPFSGCCQHPLTLANLGLQLLRAEAVQAAAILEAQAESGPVPLKLEDEVGAMAAILGLGGLAGVGLEGDIHGCFLAYCL